MAKHSVRKKLMVVAGRKFRSFECNGVRVDAIGGMQRPERPLSIVGA